MATVDERQVVAAALRAVNGLVQLPATEMWVDYDRDADVLYISFRRPPLEAESEMLHDGVILRRVGDDTVGVTVLDASKRG